MPRAGDRLTVLTVGNMYPPHHLGGYEITWQGSVDQLRRAGHSVRVLTTDFRRAERDAADDGDTHRELRWYWHDHAFPRMSPRQVIALERHNAAVFDRHLTEFRPDVLCWWAMGGMSLSLIERGRRRGLPAVGVVGDDWMDYGPRVDARTRIRRRLRLPDRPDLGRAATWLFNSRRTRDHAIALGLAPAAAEVVHPGVDPQLMVPTPAREWDWSLAYVGRIDPRKGIGAAIDVLAELPQASLRVAGAGDDAHEAELRARVRTAGADARVEFGEVARAQVPGAFAAADAVLFPVLWEEPWGLIPLEAMACGRPVVASGRGGSAEYLRDGENCLIAAPEPEAMAAALRRLAGDPRLREHLREGGLRTAARFTEAAYNQAIEAALRVSRRQRRAGS